MKYQGGARVHGGYTGGWEKAVRMLQPNNLRGTGGRFSIVLVFTEEKFHRNQEVKIKGKLH